MSTIESLNTSTQLASCRLVETGNITGVYYNGFLNNGIGATFTVAAGVLSIDAAEVAIGDFVLLAGQALGFQNGIYQLLKQGTIFGLSAVLQRRGDFQCVEQIKAGQYLNITDGLINGGSTWTVINPTPQAIGFSPTDANDINFVSTSSTTPISTQWIDAKSTPTVLLANHGFLTDVGASLMTYILPSVIPFGAEIELQGMSSGLFTVTQNAGQSINFGDVTTTVGVGGSITSTNANDYLKLLCTVDNTTFSVIGGVGNFTIV